MQPKLLIMLIAVVLLLVTTTRAYDEEDDDDHNEALTARQYASLLHLLAREYPTNRRGKNVHLLCNFDLNLWSMTFPGCENIIAQS